MGQLISPQSGSFPRTNDFCPSPKLPSYKDASISYRAKSPDRSERYRYRYERPPNISNFPDIAKLPPGVSLAILSHLNETDLCLAACVNDQWRELADDDLLWLSLCKSNWGYITAYCRPLLKYSPLKNVFLTLDEATLTFNSHCEGPEKGMEQLVRAGLLHPSPLEIAKFIHFTDKLQPERLREYLESRSDVVGCLISFQHFRNSFLPNALRDLFKKIEAPAVRGEFLETLLDCFANRFCECNPEETLSVEDVYVLCFSLILLSVDMHSPHVKNKMSKREFIRNVRGAMNVRGHYDEMLGHMYDNIYLIGHIAAVRRPPPPPH